jgi:hypothetical protein
MFECNCDKCVDKRDWYWGKGYTIWVEIPKNGSSTLKKEFSKVVYLNDFTNNKESFCIIRDPLDRFKSLLSSYFFINHRKEIIGKPWFDKYIGGEYDTQTISDIVINNFDKLSLIHMPHHFNSQSSFIPHEFYNCNYKFFGMNYLDKYRPSNVSISKDINLSNNCIEFLHDFYHEDFIIYNKFIK